MCANNVESLKCKPNNPKLLAKIEDVKNEERKELILPVEIN
jgi:hypothetical protein